MNSALNALLESYREASKTEREKGTYFEQLALVFLKNDPIQAQQYEDAWTYGDWCATLGTDRRDTGIDLVGKLRDDEGYCAIQCKFYRPEHRMQKSDIDSFFTASGKAPFTRRLIIDTTTRDWSVNAEDALRGQNIDTHRISLSDLSESAIDWSKYAKDKTVALAEKKKPREHQRLALEAVEQGLTTADRGKLIMACGTGKTYTGLIIAEKLAGRGKNVLFLVPSLALMSQTVREWTNDCEIPLRSYAVCSDVQVGKRKDGDDLGDIQVHDLAYPATTDARKLASKVAHLAQGEMTVVFSTYQSIQVISDAQKLYGLPEFDLILCDEAHRTTGATLVGDDESNFVKVHNQDFIHSKKRVYMTATPRIYGDGVKSKASEASVELCSMDDPALYGEVLFQRGFSWAVDQKLLTDYKVIVLAADDGIISTAVQNRLREDNELKLDDATKIIGCYKALTKTDLLSDVGADPNPMHRALAFCRDIKSSKLIQAEFPAVVNEYLENTKSDDEGADAPKLHCEIEHVDGTFNAKTRSELLDWIKEETDETTCRILTNARCLTEGVDVPALDAILFLHPRKSQIDVVQAVGRVMRRSEGKQMGYVILPVAIPAGLSPEEALNDNERYRVVWQILNALRSHDERFDSTINKLGLGVDVSHQIEVIAVSNQIPEKAAKPKGSANIGHGSAMGDDDGVSVPKGSKEPEQMGFVFDEFSAAIKAKIVKKCGKKDYWDTWATDIAKIAQAHITRITGILAAPETAERNAFNEFLLELRDDLNDSISEPDAIEMLAQHIITKPVFDALFEGYDFAAKNPVSVAMQSVLDVLNEHNLEKESETLQKFYASVKMRASGIDNAEGKQKIIVELYDKFFRNAFPRMTEKLGIVYTPVEVVDFIIQSVNDVLQSEFAQTVGSRGVHIIDPFTGTGTFITRLLQSGLIKPDELAYKYANEIHANEIVLLAYYIAAINIEAVYHTMSGGDYQPFEGICLTDTFQLYEKDDLVSHLMVDNSSRRQKQKELDIRVIIGNPPYSVGQSSANDNNANIAYDHLDGRIRSTYATYSKATSTKNLMDSYIRAIRWGSDRLGDAGVMAFVSGSAWIERQFADGMRKCLADEFSNLYVFNLRGDVRKNMLSKGRAGEGGNIFGSGSMTGIAISIFVKNPQASERGKIFVRDIGNNLSQQQKLNEIASLGSVAGINAINGWLRIEPDEHNDWLAQRDGSFNAFIEMGDKKGDAPRVLFSNYSLGINSNRDAWCYNASREELAKNMRDMIVVYNADVERFPTKGRDVKTTDFICSDPRKISWSSSLIPMLERGKKGQFSDDALVVGTFKPFQKTWLYYDKMFNHRTGQLPNIFPTSNVENLVICVTGVGARAGFSALMTDTIPNLHTVDSGQCFPLKLFASDAAKESNDLFRTNQKGEFRVSDGITDDGFAYFQTAYPAESISKEDIFYYTYGLLHSEEYRARYVDNLAKELPRIPTVKKSEDFWSFVNAGRDLAELHVNYEAVAAYPVTIKEGDLRLTHIGDPKTFYRVEKMRFGGSRPNTDKTTVIYNGHLTITNIPLEAYEYVVNGKSALEWVMERQVVKTDKDSGIVNDANRYANETVGDPAYPFLLFQRVITLSLETMKIVRSLPKLDI